ncbi:MAG: hypothetical protein KKA10_11750 [Euryarchaeota archaeon]|nr:hypothetical protein [Euryarchaeota archaeon]MCG2736044.1 hypothetical protein [Candidatus Methanoperedenaceae archaeon]
MSLDDEYISAQPARIEPKDETTERDKFTRWIILASGEGAGRVASLYFTKMKNEAIDDRILLMNSNRADIINTLMDLEKQATSDAERNIINQIRQKNTLLFGGGGAGNVYKEGEEYARKDFETKIRRPIEALKTGAGDVVLDIAALGGGTGNGSIPFIIHQMKHGNSVSLQNHIHVALAIFPYSSELPQRQFNAICGLSRLLKFGENSHQNADMVLMVDNSKIAEDIELSEGIDPKFGDINKKIIKAIDLMIAPGRRAKGVIDIKDYVKFPSLMNLYHFTPCISVDNDINFIELEMALDDAVKNSFVRMDPKTAVIGYLIVSVPEKYLNKGDFTEDKVNAIFSKWKKNNIIGKMGMVSLTYTKSKKDTFDVLLLLGGFSLKETLEKSWQEFKSLKKILMMASEGGHVELDNVKLSVEEIERIEGILKNYMAHTEKVIKGVQEEENEGEEDEG